MINAVIELLQKSNLAIVGGGKFCKRMIDFLASEGPMTPKLNIIGVADRDPDAEGVRHARRLGIYTTTDFNDLYKLPNLQVILEITHDPALPTIIQQTKPASTMLIDHSDVRFIWEMFRIEGVKRRFLSLLPEKQKDLEALHDLFNESFDEVSEIISRSNERSRQIELKLVENQQIQGQIIEGSTIPTFVINEDHVVTHWNKAMEKLSGWSAEQVVGTTNQWAPFWKNKRPTMADVVLTQLDEEGIRKLYGAKWRKSSLIEEAYEAEGFFPQLGENGKWCWFTAAPIKDPGGRIIGAIETLWDKTEDKKAEEERERHTYELRTLCAIYSHLNVSSDIDSGIRKALEEIRKFAAADLVCVYLLGSDGGYHLEYRHGRGRGRKVCHKVINPEEVSLHQQVTFDNGSLITEQPPPRSGKTGDGTALLGFIPISSKEKKVTGVIRIWSKDRRSFSPDQQNVLQLIGNRIGVALENSRLQAQYIKSEEKYRTLFNSDPHPIFILDSKIHCIKDINQRVGDRYGYTREELIGIPFLKLGDENDQDLAQGLKHIAADHSILFTKKRHFRKDGQPFYVDVNLSHASYGKTDVIIASTTDITESVEKETQLIQASKLTTLGQMTAGMAHELNQPLNVIQVCADYFEKCLNRGIRISDEDLRSMANDIGESVQRAAGIIRHMRDFARQSEVTRTPIDINRPIEDVFKVLGRQLKVHQIELRLELDPDLPSILAEHNRLEQVFINLVINAIDAMDEKGERLGDAKWERILTIRSFQENGKVAVMVSDTGIGMSPAVKEKMFEPFFTTKEVGRGTGLGVAISYGIIKDYNGTVEVESEVGKGTTFKICFPIGGSGGQQ